MPQIIDLSHTIFKKAFDCSPDGIIVCNNEGEIKIVNEATSKIFGYGENELLGKNFDILIPNTLREHHKFLFKGYQKEPSSRPMSNKMKLLGLKKNGDEIFISISLNVLEKERGSELFLAVIRDTTEFIRNTDILENTMLQLKEALKISKLGNWELDVTKNKLTWSPEVYEIFELDPNLFFPNNENFEKLIHEEDRDFAIKSYQNSIINQIPYNIVHRYITPSGSLKHLRERGVNVYDDFGKVIKTLGTVQDITDLHEQRIILDSYVKKLEDQNKQLEDYTRIAAHDLQEPINNIKGITFLLHEEFKHKHISIEEISEYLNMIKKAGERIYNLNKALMDTARLGQINPMTEVDCSQILYETLEGMEYQIKASNANVEFDVLPSVHGYKYELGLLFQNLISNALKYKDKQVTPTIKIGFHDQGTEYLFTIEDNGIGIDPKHKGTLFRMFKRLHTQDEIEGTGIGLAQCKKIVEQHNGQIWFESEVGKGSIFYFTLRKTNN